MNKIWLDVTTILSWNRPAVGVVRVEAECASYALQACNEPISFCQFVPKKGYVQVSPFDVESALKRIQGSDAISEEGEKHAALVEKKQTVASREQRLKALTLHLIGMLPPRLQTAALNYAKRNKDKVLGRIEWMSNFPRLLKNPFSRNALLQPDKTERHHTTPANPFGACPFSQADVYVSMGLDWDQKAFTYLYELKRRTGFKTLMFCYDLIPVKFPHLCVGDVSAIFAKYFADMAWCANHILCISESSLKDLESLLAELHTPVPRLSVVKLGCNIPQSDPGIISEELKQIISQPYILYVSTIERRKNHETLYKAYTRLVDQGKSPPLLVFVGMPGWGVNDLLADLRLDPRVQGHIKVLSHVTDSELAVLYANALFTVYPSLYEGWGLPIAEGLALGKFCLASNTSSIPEVGGSLIDYLDPWDVEKWANSLMLYVTEKELLTEKEENIKKQYTPTDWKETAGHIIAQAISLSYMSESGLGYEERLQNLYSSVLQRGDHCIDIGAHVGRHTIPMACSVGDHGTVTSFEPNPDIASILRNRISNLSLDNVEILEYALSDVNTETAFVVAVDLPEESGLRKRSVYNAPTETKEIRVEVKRLDDMGLNEPRFLKIDTEGAEYAVLLGAHELLRSHKPVIAFEFGAASYAAYDVNPEDVYDFLSALEYSILSIYGKRLDKETFVEDSVTQKYWDYIACTDNDLRLIQQALSDYKPR